MDEKMQQIEFGKRIAECRRERQLTQEELANRMGVTSQALSQYERGLRYPDVGILKSLCGILGVSSDYLLGIEDKKITETGNPKIQSEIWRNLRTALEPLMIIFGQDIVPAFMDNAFVDKIVDLRLRLSREGLLMPIIKIQDRLNLKPREFMILAYDNILYQEIISEEQDISADIIIQRLESTVRTRYDEILNVDMVKDLTDNLRINHNALIDGIVPEKITYSLLTSVCKAFVKRGNTLLYLPRMIELLEDLRRRGELGTDEEIAEYVSQQIMKKENLWIWLHDHAER